MRGRSLLASAPLSVVCSLEVIVITERVLPFFLVDYPDFSYFFKGLGCQPVHRTLFQHRRSQVRVPGDYGRGINPRSSRHVEEMLASLDR